MDEGRDGGRADVLGRALPPAFELEVVVVESGSPRGYDEGEWREALVVVGSGEIELESRGGARARFVRGDVLWLDGLPLRALHNPRAEPAQLVAVRSRAWTKR
jgi:hypothetical protein